MLCFTVHLKAKIISVFVLVTATAYSGIILDSFTNSAAGSLPFGYPDVSTPGCMTALPGFPDTGMSLTGISGTTIMGRTGTRSLALSSVQGSGCILADIPNQPTTGAGLNLLQFTSGNPDTSATLTETGLGNAYTLLAGDGGIQFEYFSNQFSPDLVFGLHVAGAGFVTTNPFNLGPSPGTTSILNLSQFVNGGTIAPGSVIDGYEVIIDGVVGTQVSINEIQTVFGAPEPVTLTLSGIGLVAILLGKRASGLNRVWNRRNNLNRK